MMMWYDRMNHVNVSIIFWRIDEQISNVSRIDDCSEPRIINIIGT